MCVLKKELKDANDSLDVNGDELKKSKKGTSNI